MKIFLNNYMAVSWAMPENYVLSTVGYTSGALALC